MSSIQWIRDHYGVPAKVGMRIIYAPCEGSRDLPRGGMIVGTKGPYLRIRLDGEKRIGSYHPTWQVQYPTPQPNVDEGDGK